MCILLVTTNMVFGNNALLLTAVYDWAACVERHHSIHCVFLDLAMAFDSVLSLAVKTELATLVLGVTSYPGWNIFLTK